MNKKRLIILILCILFFPLRNNYNEGQIREYKSLTYQIIIWNYPDNNYDSGYKTGTDVHIFPNNFKKVEYYIDTQPQRLRIIYNNVDYYANTGSYHWCNSYNNCSDVERLMDSDFNNYNGITINSNISLSMRTQYSINTVTIYRDSFNNVFKVVNANEQLTIPSEAGIYLLKYSVSEGNNTVDYYFRINKI